MRSYHRLTEVERNQVYALKKAGLTQCAIAEQICVNKSMISRELKRNTGLRGYRPKQAHRLACARQSQISRIRILDAIWTGTGIAKMIREDWSPEQIRVTLKIMISQASALRGFTSISIPISEVVATFTPT